MTLRNVPNSFTLEQQRQEVNLIAVDLESAVTGTQTFTGEKTFSNDVKFQTKAIWDNDLEIYNFNDGIGSTNFISSTSELIISTDQTNPQDIVIRNGGDTAIFAHANAAVDLYYDNAKKFETTSTGVTVTGDISIGDGDQILLGDDVDLKIYYDGSVGVETSFIDSDALQIRSATDNSELYATFLKDGPVELYHDGTKRFGTSSTGASVLGDLTVSSKLTFDNAGSHIEFTPSSWSGSAPYMEFWVGNNGGAQYAQIDGGNAGQLSIHNTGHPNGHLDLRTKKDFSVECDGYYAILAQATGATKIWHPVSQEDILSPTFETTATGAKVNGFFESSFLVNTNNTPTAGEGIEMFYDSAASGGAAGTIQAYDRDGSALNRLKIRSSNWEILNDGAATFAGTVDAAGFTVGGSDIIPDVATSSTVGTVKPDDDTIEVDANGEISCTGKLNWTSGSNFYPEIGIRKIEAVNTNSSFTQPSTDIQIARFANFGTQGTASQTVGSYGLTTKDTQVIIESFTDSGGSPSIVFRSGGTNMVVGQLYAGTTDNKLVLGPGLSSNTNPTQVTALTIDGLNNVEVNNLAISGQSTGSGATNTVLTHYEEGTWTPVVKSGTDTITFTGGTQSYTYTRIGDTVHLYFAVDGATTSGTTGGFWTVEGLPFDPTYNFVQGGSPTSNGFASVGSAIWDDVGFQASNWPALPYIESNDNVINFYTKTSATGPLSSVTVSNVGGSSKVHFAITYKTGTT